MSRFSRGRAAAMVAYCSEGGASGLGRLAREGSGSEVRPLVRSGHLGVGLYSRGSEGVRWHARGYVSALRRRARVTKGHGEGRQDDEGRRR